MKHFLNIFLSLIFFSALCVAQAQTLPQHLVDQIEALSFNTFVPIEEGGEADATRNASSLDVSGDENGSVLGEISQQGGGNTTLLIIDGDANNFNINQNSAGAQNVSGVVQAGADNSAIINQDATGLIEGQANLVLISQDGMNNSANIEQLAVSASAISFSNSATVTQIGNGNTATTHQNGVNNRTVQTQEGDNNLSEILQLGNDNLAVHEQFGDNLSLPDGVYGTVGIEQFGGATIIIQQCASGC